MVAQAQNNVMAHAEEAQQERNIQRLIDASTKDISVSIYSFALEMGDFCFAHIMVLFRFMFHFCFFFKKGL